MNLSRKQFLTIITASGTIIIALFIAILIQLPKRNVIVYTDAKPLTTPELHRTDPVMGSASPDVLIVAYNNFACRTCADVSEALRELVATEPRVAVVWKDFPNASLFPESVPASIAARCAHDQHAFSQYHDMLFANQGELGAELYTEIAEDLGLRPKKFARCLRREEAAELVAANLEEAQRLNLTGAPTIFINNTRFTGSLRATDLRLMVQALLPPTP